MRIAILGTGCAKCRKTEDVVKRAVRELGVDATIFKVEDVREIIEHGVMLTPALVVNGEVVVAGRVPTVDEVKQLLGRL